MFLDMSPLAVIAKSKNKQVGLRQTEKLLHSEETINKTKRPTDWEKIFANDICHQGLVKRYTKNSYMLTSKKQTA